MNGRLPQRSCTQRVLCIGQLINLPVSFHDLIGTLESAGPAAVLLDDLVDPLHQANGLGEGDVTSFIRAV